MRNITLLLAVAFVAGLASWTHGETSVGSSVSSILTRMENSQLRQREAALNDLCKLASNDSEQKGMIECPTALNKFFGRHPDQVEGITIALIKLLTTQNGVFLDKDIAPGTYTEADMEHYASLIDIVSSLNDERSIPPLAGAITTGGVATQGLLKYGQKALAALLDQLSNSSDPMVRSESLATAVTLLLRQNDPAARVRIGELIQSGLQDKQFLLRVAAIQAIERVDCRASFVPELTDLAEHDSFRIPGQAEGGGDDYPVRREAKRVLQKIAAQERPLSKGGSAQ